jgi:carboxypeptidase C (cathepsin A)
MTDDEQQQAAAPSPPPGPVPEDSIVEADGLVRIGNRDVRYTVTTGTLVLREEAERPKSDGESEGERPRATVFFVAYTRKGVDDAAKRPITFSFNGGPGSSSVWLHLGVLGPRRVAMGELGELPPPPYRATDNPHSLLDVSDLVFIDPVSTGFSRPVEGEKAREFHTVKRDIESVGDFIRLYTTRYRRWSSPKFLIGESYGTTRAAGLAGYLQERHGMYLNGIMLLSAVLDFQTILFGPPNELPYVLFLPAFTATAFFHGRLEKGLQKDLRATLSEAEVFATGEYATALLKGSSLAPADRERVIAGLARYTGLSPEFLDRSNLRVSDARFFKELLRSEGKTVGRLDSRFTGLDRDSAGESASYDPSLTNIIGPYTAAFNDYVRRELGYETDLPYEVLSAKVNEGWTFPEDENRFLSVAETLRSAMTVNPYLRLFIGSGYYDLATPYFATEYTVNHLGLHSSLASNVELSYYEAGHMMYTHEPSLAALKGDLANFLANSAGGG